MDSENGSDNDRGIVPYGSDNDLDEAPPDDHIERLLSLPRPTLPLTRLCELPIYRLPAELILNILETLDTFTLSNFAVGASHLLWCHGIIPNNAARRLESVRNDSRNGGSRTRIGAGTRSLPPELWLNIGRTLGFMDKISFILALLAVF